MFLANFKPRVSIIATGLLLLLSVSQCFAQVDPDGDGGDGQQSVEPGVTYWINQAILRRSTLVLDAPRESVRADVAALDASGTCYLTRYSHGWGYGEWDPLDSAEMKYDSEDGRVHTRSVTVFPDEYTGLLHRDLRAYRIQEGEDIKDAIVLMSDRNPHVDWDRVEMREPAPGGFGSMLYCRYAYSNNTEETLKIVVQMEYEGDDELYYLSEPVVNAEPHCGGVYTFAIPPDVEGPIAGKLHIKMYELDGEGEPLSSAVKDVIFP